MKGLFNRVLIATDLSSIDISLLKACNELIDIIGIKKIYLVHIIPDFNAPENENLNFHKLFSINYPVDETSMIKA